MKLTVKNQLGLHARAAAKVVNTIKKYNAKVFFAKNGQIVEAESILNLLTLACGPGCTIDVNAEGPDSKEVIQAIKELFDTGFGEE